MRHTLQWFKDRVGKKIIRTTKLNCNDGCCKPCRRSETVGLVVSDEFHADYLKTCQDEMGLVYEDKEV